ncbi:WecB/TagA/CpsF family glycosyltransferase [Patescibacteria group bacterium]|nr:WecB/TagA/CpsF family glycosyltransferase [Patescibacteria group bacterium]
MNKIDILGIKINTNTKKEILNELKKSFEFNKQFYITTPNPEIILKALKNDKYKNILNNSYISIPDGIGLILASKFLYKKNYLKERISGSDFVYDLLELCEKKEKKIFLLGGNNEDQLNRVEKNLFNKFNNLIISGKNLGYDKNNLIIGENYNLIDVENKTKTLIEQINYSNTDVLLVAFGAPKQELWIYENLNKLKNIKIAIGIGGTFDFISGYKKRAPKIFIRFNLEWLFRLIQEPRRLKRIFNAVIIFPIKIIKYRLKNAKK